MSECIGCDIAEQASMVCEICRGEKVAKATMAAKAKEIETLKAKIVELEESVKVKAQIITRALHPDRISH